ncbi:hypothetical protein ACQ4PT_060139 [Festuca glaucescens]
MGKKKIASRTAGDVTFGKARATGWCRLKYTDSDLHKLRKFGLLPATMEAKLAGDEAVPRPDDGWRVMFTAFIFRGLSLPAHEFLRGLLFVYGVQLHQLTPNSILHIACFITLCECFLGIHPHWDLWTHLFFLRQNAMKTAVHDVGGAIVSVRPEAKYFNLKMAESVQNWRKKWFYIKDEKVGEQNFGFAPFNPMKEVKKLKSWDQTLTETELKETEPLMARIHALQSDKGKELSGLQIMTHFLRLRVQPIQARVSALWTYSGSKEPTRVSKENVSTSELEKLAQQFTRLTQKDDIPSSYRVDPFDKKHPPPAGHDHLNCLPPLPKGGEVPEAAVDPEEDKETMATEEKINEEDSFAESFHSLTSIPSTDEDESPKSPAAGRAKTLEAPASTPMKPMSSREQTADSMIPKDPAAGLEARPKKKSKKGDANKGIKIAENPVVPSMDDPIMHEMVYMATRCIGFRDKASSLEVALQNSEEIREDAMKRGEALEAKLKAAKKALEEVQARAKSEEERWEEENARMATREAEICQRLNTLSASLTKITDYSLQLGKDHEVDPLLDSLSILERNSVWARSFLSCSRRAFKRLHGHLFPKEKVPEDFDELVGLFNGEPDPMLEHRRAMTKTGSEVSMAMVMAHGAKVDWEKTTINNSPNPTSSSDPSGQDEMTKESNTPENSDVITRIIDLPLYTEKVCRIKELRDELKKVKGQVIVSLSKAKRATKREDFILEEISRASETMKCICLSPVDEAKRLRNRMNALYEASSGTANDFWTDNKRSHVLALLQDRVLEVGEFVECCCSAMALIYNAMFPRNPQP